MKSFTYQAPSTLDQALTLLSENNGRVRPMAGGTDLLVQLRSNLHDIDMVIDIKKIPEVNQISYHLASGLIIGAAVSCAQIYETVDVVSHYPCLVDVASIIGGIAIQNRATFGGNLCNASPSGDAISAMIVLGAICNIAGSDGTRSIPIEHFCLSPGKNVLERGEILLSIQLPPPRDNSGATYLRFTPRAEMDIAVAGVGAAIELSDDLSKIISARIALAAVAPTPVLATAVAEILIGSAPTEHTFSLAAKVAKESVDPITDVRGTAAQRRHLVGVLTRRSLTGALGRACGEG